MAVARYLKRRRLVYRTARRAVAAVRTALQDGDQTIRLPLRRISNAAMPSPTSGPA